MPQESISSAHPEFIYARYKRKKIINFFGWGLSIVFSAVLNASLFCIMPGMIHNTPENKNDLENIQAIQLVRIKKPETPPRKKQRPKPEKQGKKQAPSKKPAKALTPTPMAVKPALPFELNSRLPRAVDSLVMPGLAHFSLNPPAFKGQYLVDELDSPLTPLAKIPPIYPIRASRRGIEGWVKIQFVVNESGTVENLKVIEAQPEGIFDKSVVNCLVRWKFKPGTVQGIAVSTLVETIINFQLD
ncbi:TonB family protein [Desulfobacula sp.]